MEAEKASLEVGTQAVEGHTLIMKLAANGSSGYGGLGSGSSLYRILPGSAGASTGDGYPETGYYGLSSYHISQLHQPA